MYQSTHSGVSPSPGRHSRSAGLMGWDPGGGAPNQCSGRPRRLTLSDAAAEATSVG